MRVRISYVVEVDDGVRRRINEYNGDSGLASREQVKRWFRHWGGTMDDEVLGEPCKENDVRPVEKED